MFYKRLRGCSQRKTRANSLPILHSSAGEEYMVRVKRKIRILVAEDNLVNQVLATRLLERQGHSVVIAFDGRQAIQAFETNA